MRVFRQRAPSSNSGLAKVDGAPTMVTQSSKTQDDDNKHISRKRSTRSFWKDVCNGRRGRRRKVGQRGYSEGTPSYQHLFYIRSKDQCLQLTVSVAPNPSVSVGTSYEPYDVDG